MGHSREKAHIPSKFFGGGCFFHDCSRKEWKYCSEEQREFLDRIGSEKPVSVIYDKNQEASERFTITDTDTICELVQALCDIGIEAPTEIYSTDSDDIFTFIMDDEKKYSFSFNGHNFEAEDGKLYTVTDKAGFWKMALQIADSE